MKLCYYEKYRQDVYKYDFSMNDVFVWVIIGDVYRFIDFFNMCSVSWLKIHYFEHYLESQDGRAV